MRYTFLIFIAILTNTGVMAQQPFVTGLDRTSGFFGETVTISGQNFTGSLQVNFGAGRATITSQASNQLQVTVPSTATDGYVTVTSLTNGLSGSSAEKFTLKYGGETLTATDFNTDFELETSGLVSWAVCGCDLDMDGDTDFVTTNQGNGRFNVFINSSTPTFTSFTSTTITSAEMRNTTCDDINGDGKPDLVLATNSGSAIDQVFIIQNTNTIPGTSTFNSTAYSNSLKIRLPEVTPGNGRAPQQVKIADMDGDGKKDLVVGNATDNRLFIYINTSSLSTISFEANPFELVVTTQNAVGEFDLGDMNNDGTLDLVIHNGSTGSNENISVVSNRSLPGTLSFGSPFTIAQAGAWINSLLIDLDNDGYLDIFATNNSGNRISTFKNTTSGSTISFGSPNNVTVSLPSNLSNGDFNGDGRSDVIVSSLSGKISIFLNNGSVIQSPPVEVIIPETDPSKDEAVRYLVGGDVNGDSKPDISYISRSKDGLLGQFAVAINRNCFAPTISPSNQTFCFGSPFTVESIPGIGLTYSWSVVGSGSATFSNQTGRQVDVTVTTGTTITIQSTVTSSDGCVSNGTQEFTITGGSVPPAPTITSNQAGTICSGGDFTLSTPNSADTWVWTQPDGTVTTSSTLTITGATAGDAGPYTLRIKNVDECTSEAGTFNVVVDQPPLISIVNNGEDNFCSTNSTELEVANYSPEFTYRWYRDNTLIDSQTSTSFTVTQSGSYTAEIVSPNICTLTSTAYTVTAVTPPTSNFNSDSEICVDVELPFAAVSTGETGFALDYAWDFGDGNTATGANVSHAFTAANTYTVQLTTSYADVNVCSDVITKDIIVSAIPTIAITAPDGSFEKCPSDSVRLELPQNYQSYLWSTGDTTYFTYAKTADRFETSVTIDVDAVTNVGCSITSTTDVSNFANSSFTITSNAGTFVSDTLRLEEALARVDLSASGGTNFSWAPATIVSAATGATTTIFPNTEFNVVALTGTDVNGCTETINLVIVNPGLLPRKTFSPNGDGMGYECWEIANSDQVTGCELFILDSRGRIIHEATSPFTANCAWDGTVDGGSGAAPEGIYFFVLKCENEDLNLTGSILLGR